MFASYLITDPHFYSQDPAVLCETLAVVFAHHTPTYACLRDKSASNYSALAKIFIPFVQSRGVKAVLHSNVDLALALGADGVHLPFPLAHRIAQAKEKGLYVMASTHTHEEALTVQKEGADAITFSPIFPTPDKGPAVGLEKLKEIIGILSLDVFALGGIVTDAQIRLCKQAGASGFASIRYFCNPR
ncbi:MAG: thiamine phosphate synthase [Campylobacterales bacterium]|nr:thiamine phosphate synthase [Campylobacterales bacterium]